VSWLSVLNFIEAIELLEVVTDFQFKPSEKKPDFCVYDNQNQGYTLCVKANMVNAEYLEHIKATAESRKLGLRESQGYLVIYGP